VSESDFPTTPPQSTPSQSTPDGSTPDQSTPQPAPPSTQQAPGLDADVARAGEQLDRLRAELRKAVVGQDEVIDQVLCAFLASGHVLVEGVPGLGKTLLVLSLARTFGGTFGRVQFTPDLMPSDVTGHAIYHATSGDFRIRKGPIFTNLLLADEINRAPAKTQAALLEVMQERQVSIEGHSYELEPPFMTLATQNPIEQDGTYPLPEAQLDRFLFKIEIDYPAEEHEFAIVEEVTVGRVGDSFNIDDVEQVMTIEQARKLQQVCAKVRVDRRIVEYGVRLVRATRGWPGIRAGAGPRGAISIIRAARAFALLDGRDHVIPDDVKSVMLPALRHRILRTPEVEIDGIAPDDLLRDVLRKVEVPRT
jgi:MoxR-like ATPase